MRQDKDWRRGYEKRHDKISLWRHDRKSGERERPEEGIIRGGNNDMNTMVQAFCDNLKPTEIEGEPG
ncbi:hypothetical protein C1H46_022462 [Malus baccata]|uniref:Uncharacterized protein n=1 Tax=Malus baccata TaxID=106549 RepID=A0A540LZV3_MALBA|nr:hypothetical protein C1H46_022462 [Malus baccata]